MAARARNTVPSAAWMLTVTKIHFMALLFPVTVYINGFQVLSTPENFINQMLESDLIRLQNL